MLFLSCQCMKFYYFETATGRLQGSFSRIKTRQLHMQRIWQAFFNLFTFHMLSYVRVYVEQFFIINLICLSVQVDNFTLASLLVDRA